MHSKRKKKKILQTMNFQTIRLDLEKKKPLKK
jgi:hypothetical protein